MIVMVLMGMLALLGVLFYTFAAQERSNAEYYSDSAKATQDASLSADTLFDWALDQIIVGTDRRLKNSALWGSRHSLLSNSNGFGDHAPGDLHVFNGQGVNLIYDANGNIAVDQDRNGKADDGVTDVNDFRFLLDYNDSPSAPKLFDSGERQVFNGTLTFPQTDVGYTYPDINNVFLTYVGKVRDDAGAVHKVVKPAYLLPGLLRAPISGISAPLPNEDANLNGILDPGEDSNGNSVLDDPWYSSPSTASRIMRAHPSHLYVPPSGTPTVKRYLTDADAVTLIGTGAFGFPPHPMAGDYDTTPTGSGRKFTRGRMGPYSNLNANPTLDDPIEFDWDNDGDGTNEAILMDLDFPPQQDASGKLYVPLFLVTIHDLDALINLNVHGNLAKILYGPNDVGLAEVPVQNSTSHPFGTNSSGTAFFSVSQSNLGLSPSEINPFWALNARPGIEGPVNPNFFTQHKAFFNIDPIALSGTNPKWGETANMELTWSKIGRLNFSGTTIDEVLPGIYGEEFKLFNAKTGGSISTPGGLTLPRPGVSLLDDNGDVNEGQASVPFFQHPLDFTGLGTYLSASNPKQLNWSTAVGVNQWISYILYGNSGTTTADSNVLWGQATSAQLMTNSITQGLGDDPNEITFYSPNLSVDNIFTSDEMLYLNVSNGVISTLNLTSRLATLLPFNFAKLSTDNSRGDKIRKKFTVDSNDRKSFGLPVSIRTFGTAGTGQEYGQDFNAGVPSGTFRFPPQFSTTSAPIVTVPRYSTTSLAQDPFRPVTRTLLEVEFNSLQSQNRLQRKLSINQLLTADSQNRLTFSDLTPHPIDPGAAAVVAVAYPPTTDAGREFWARNDRQMMARDIYVLLYLLGHGDDTKNTAMTSNATFAVYTEAQLREMAQFAVNLVDSMDRDNVITRFEYDKDLSNGWNLDDNAYGPIEALSPNTAVYTISDTNYDPSYPNDSATRGEVYGIERLDLSISESLLIQAKKSSTSANYTQTNYDESTADRFFFYTELINSSPFPVTLGPNECWQVVLRQEATSTQSAWERRLILTDNTVTIDSSSAPYVIGSTDSSAASNPNTFKRSTFAVDPNWTGAPTTRIIPNKPSTATNKDCDLDVVETQIAGASGKFRIEDETSADITSSAVGSFLNAFTGATPIANTGTNSVVKVLLRRRVHPTRSTSTSPASVNDNPWVEVDSMMLSQATSSTTSGFRVFDLSTSPDMTKATTELTNLKSRERPQPLEGGAFEVVSTGVTGVANTFNTFGVTNSQSTTPYSIWQQHFDRSYASLMDLLYVPVFSPHQLTVLSKFAFGTPPDKQVSNPLISNPNWQIGPPGSVTNYSIKAKSASAKFLVPEDPSNIALTTPIFSVDNRWHRILEFLEVPTRTNVNLGVGTAFTIPRVPGKINLNMLRHPDILASLLDDSRIVSLDLEAVPPDADAPTLNDKTGENTLPSGSGAENGTLGRDWWRQFLLSRDPVEPFAAVNSSLFVPLPGLPNASNVARTSPAGTFLPDARPFRSFADIGYRIDPSNSGVQHASIADTVLRSLPLDSALSSTTSKRTLFEIGNQTEHQGGTIDPYIRNRLLSKISGNTTTRSNCFAIFISVKNFQAAQDSTGAVRIGGPLNGKADPEYKGFFVVDRSKLESGQTSTGPTYDFRSFINYRKTIQSP